MKKLLLVILMLGSLSVYSSTKADHSIWNELLMKNVSSSGKVNYKSFKVDLNKLADYLIELKKHAPAGDWSKSEKMAYYINLYNAYTIQLVLAKYPVKSVKDVRFSGKDIWQVKLVKSGDKIYSLSYVENGILRKMGDPRIHFAINCASYSCPKLLNKAFTASNLEANLKKLTVAYINDQKHNIIAPKKVKLSQIFEWYATDFTSSKSTLIDYLNKYSTIPINTNAKIEYIPYNWSLNE